MKRTLSRLAVVSLFILGSICLTPYAGDLGNVHIAEIPFDFYIANELLSAGEYTFKNSFLHPGVILAQDSKGRSVCALTFRKTTREADSSRLVFNRYGDKHFLHEIWGASRTGRESRAR